MRKITLLTLAIWLFGALTLIAQTIPPTGGGAASVNPPASWIGATASTSNKSLYQGNAAKPWKNGSIPAVPGQANATFLSLYSNNSVITETTTTITGLQAGWIYDFSYYVMTGSAMTPAGFTDFAYAAEVAVDFTIKQFSLSSANAVNVWIPGTLQFQATGTTAKLKFRTLGQTSKGSISNLSITPGSLKVVCGANPQVPLTKTSIYNKCFQQYANLNDAFTGVVPPGWSLRWFTSDTHSGVPILFPTMVTTPGEYYAFFYDGNWCFNTNLSTAKVTVTINPPLPGDGQVMLNKAAITNECPITSTVDLTTAFTSPLPPGAVIKWFDNPTHSGLAIADPAHASASVSQYYAFFYDSGNNCYNTANSTAIIKVTKRPCLPPPTLPVFTFSENVNAEGTPDIAMYPNPVSDEIQIMAADFDAISKVQIHNMTGLTIYESNEKPVKTINVKNFTPGMYIVNVKLKNGTSSSYKVMVVK